MYAPKITLLLFFLFTKGIILKNDPITISTLIERTGDAYAKTVRYLDSGKVVSTFKNAGISPTSTAIYFRTAYSDAGPFNFEYYKLGQSNSLYIINRDKKRMVQSWWGINNKTRTYLTLDEALAAAQGVSTLASTMIPKFLLVKDGALGLNIFNEMRDHLLLQPEMINKTLCYKLSGSYKTGTAIVWIGQNDFLIRKIHIDQTIKNIEFHTEYFFTPYNSSDNAEFQFRPNRTIKL